MEQEGGADTGAFDIATHEFQVPAKKIDDIPTHERFKKSEAHNELLGFIGMLTAAVKGSRMTETPLTEVG